MLTKSSWHEMRWDRVWGIEAAGLISCNVGTCTSVWSPHWSPPVQPSPSPPPHNAVCYMVSLRSEWRTHLLPITSLQTIIGILHFTVHSIYDFREANPCSSHSLWSTLRCRRMMITCQLRLTWRPIQSLILSGTASPCGRLIFNEVRRNPPFPLFNRGGGNLLIML